MRIYQDVVTGEQFIQGKASLFKGQFHIRLPWADKVELKLSISPESGLFRAYLNKSENQEYTLKGMKVREYVPKTNGVAGNSVVDKPGNKGQ